MFRFVHAADIHLDSPLRGLSERMEGATEALHSATRHALKRLVDLCIIEHVDFLLIAGDLYDGDWPDYHTGLFFIQCMADLNRHGIPVFLIRGNHDAASQITKQLTLPNNVHEFAVDRPETVRLDQLGVALHGQSFATRDVRDNLAIAYPEPIPGFFNIGLLHTALEGIEGHEPYAPCRLSDLIRKGYDYWALGHVHRRQVVHESPWIVYPGNLQGRHVREAGEKGCYLVTVEGRDVQLEHRPLDVLRWDVLEVDLTGADQAEDIPARVQAAVDERLRDNPDMPLALRIELVGETRLHGLLVEDPQRWRQEALAVLAQMEQPVWLEKLLVRTMPPPSQDVLAVRGEAWRILQESLTAALADEAFVQRCLDEIRRVQQRLGPYLHKPESLRVEGRVELEGLAQDARVILGELLQKGERR